MQFPSYPLSKDLTLPYPKKCSKTLLKQKNKEEPPIIVILVEDLQPAAASDDSMEAQRSEDLPEGHTGGESGGVVDDCHQHDAAWIVFHVVADSLTSDFLT